MMIVLVWLLMAGVAGAEQLDFTTTQSTSGVLRFIQCPDAGPEVCELTLHIDPGYTVLYQGRSVACMEKMQAAMEAMEPYMIELSSDGTARFVLRDSTGLKPAYQLWADAKTCWRKP